MNLFDFFSTDEEGDPTLVEKAKKKPKKKDRSKKSKKRKRNDVSFKVSKISIPHNLSCKIQNTS